MWMNLDIIPAGKAMYTVAVTTDPADTPSDEVGYDEVDTVQSTHITAREVVRQVREEILADYGPNARVVGVSNQSDGYVMWQSATGNLLED